MKKLILIAVLLLPAFAFAETKIKTSSIADAAVTTPKLAENAVTAGKIVDGAVGAAEIDASAVGTSEIADGTVAAGDLAASLDLSGKTLTLPAANTSRVVQVVNTQTGAVASGTTVLPYDDTIPQNTEGDQFLSLAITPTNASHLLRIDVVLQVSHSAVNTVSIALFQDSTANALAASGANSIAASPQAGVLTHYMTAGTTSATTFKVRAGGSGAGTLTVNGNGGARRFGGVIVSSITITEIRN